MKKFVKVLIALVVVAGLAVGAYFLFVKKDNSKLVYENVYNLTYNIIDEQEDVNIVAQVSSTVSEMQTLITAYDMDIDTVASGLMVYSNLKNFYSDVTEQILAYGSFVKNNNIDKYIHNATTSYNKVVEIYKNAYAYLQDTYYKIADKSAYVQTVKSYIQNFYNIFEPILTEYNNFFYNTSIAYAYGLENSMQKNNFYKLKIEYYAETVNQYYLSENDKVALVAHIYTIKSSLDNDYSEAYFDNKQIYDELMSKSKDLKVGDLVLKIVKLEIQTYIDSLPTEAERKVVQNYVDYVVRG